MDFSSKNELAPIWKNNKGSAKKKLPPYFSLKGYRKKALSIQASWPLHEKSYFFSPKQFEEIFLSAKHTTDYAQYDSFVKAIKGAYRIDQLDNCYLQKTYELNLNLKNSKGVA
jgi:hypothetical protein